jgi:4-amino-4-deoxy-L-arabinose transferase-like glycosyltransferase
MPPEQSAATANENKLFRWSPWLVFFLALLVNFPSVWSETSVTCSDEYQLSFRTPMEMHARGEWLTPWLNGEPRLRKPPLIYWAMLSSYKLFGANLVSARIWAVLAGAGLCLSACLLARQLSRTNGLLAGLLAMGCVGVATQARQALLDLPLAVFTSFAVLFWLKWLRGEKFSYMFISAVWVGLAFLMKGPIGLFFFAAGALAALWAFNAWNVLPRRAGQLLIWIAIVAAISLPWPLAMRQLWGDHFSQIVGEELADRKFGTWNAMSPFSALGGALGLIFPWTPMVAGAVIAHLRRAHGERSQNTSWLLAWFFVSILPFFFMKAFERYMLAVIPLQAVLAADWIQSTPTRWETFAWRLSLILLAVVGVFVSAFALWFKLGIVGPLLCLATTGFCVHRAFRGSEPMLTTAGAAAMLALCLGLIYPTLGISGIAPDVKEKIGGLAARNFGMFQPALLSMRLGYSVQTFNAEKFLAAQTNAPFAEAVFVEESHVADFEKLASERGLKIEEAGRFKTFYSRKAWLRFARADARWPEWKHAIGERSLESLKTEIRYFRVSKLPASP